MSRVTSGDLDVDRLAELRLHLYGMIKIAASRRGDEQTVSREAIAAVVEEAHRHAAKVSIHSRGSGSTRDAAPVGVDWIFHADLATEADLENVAAAGIPIMFSSSGSRQTVG
jgi:imidazolonepropionase-like amidohydrolase